MTGLVNNNEEDYQNISLFEPLLLKPFLFSFVSSETITCPILGPLVPILWIFCEISSYWVLPYLHCGGECNEIHL